MGIAELHPMVTRIGGRVGGIVFYSYNGVTYIRSYVTPRNPDTIAQRTNRNLFARAMMAWQALSMFDRDSFNRRARKFGMSGHNLFISRYMKLRDDHATQQQGDSTAPASVPARMYQYFPSTHGIGRSVDGSVMMQTMPDACLLPDVHPPGN